MFSTHEIKDSRRGQNKRIPPSPNELFEERVDERTLPYFSIVPEQVFADERYHRLDAHLRGLFWCFVVHALWREGGRCPRHPGIIAKRMGIPVAEWEALEKRLLDCALVQLSPDGFYLVQLELRAQFLMTLVVNNHKRRTKEPK